MRAPGPRPWTRSSGNGGRGLSTLGRGVGGVVVVVVMVVVQRIDDVLSGVGGASGEGASDARTDGRRRTITGRWAAVGGGERWIDAKVEC